MKTLTEFSSSVIKAAIKAKQDLVTAGKTIEEIPAALGESLKLEGEKLTFVIGAIELVERKLEDLKRVVVMKLNEGEKAPGGVVQKGEHCFSAEYYPPLNPPKAAHGKDHRHDGKGSKDRKGGRNGRDKGRRPNKGADGGARNPRGPRVSGEVQAGADNGPANPSGERPAIRQERRPPRQRPPRREEPASPPKPPGWVVKPKSDTPTEAASHDHGQAAPTSQPASETAGPEKV